MEKVEIMQLSNISRKMETLRKESKGNARSQNQWQNNAFHGLISKPVDSFFRIRILLKKQSTNLKVSWMFPLWNAKRKRNKKQTKNKTHTKQNIPELSGLPYTANHVLTVGRFSEVWLIWAGPCWVAPPQARAVGWALSWRLGQVNPFCLSSLQDNWLQEHICRVEQAPPTTTFKASAHLYPPAFQTWESPRSSFVSVGHENTGCCGVRGIARWHGKGHAYMKGGRTADKVTVFHFFDAF